uniref:Uncharacterized protein n=1 Tax=Magnetospirillum gryphiswaldense TaxID=55518 RepID=A4U4H1_9PROT|nr:hypothetical protein MGR_3846 [Magnetospirillum gryphiswaldense MSR-1]
MRLHTWPQAMPGCQRGVLIIRRKRQYFCGWIGPLP